VAKLLGGKTLVLVGGDRRPYAQQALEQAFALKELDWIVTAEHESILPFEGQHRQGGRCGRSAGEFAGPAILTGKSRTSATRHGKPLVRLPGRLQPNQVASKILNQCGDRLKASPGG